MVATTQPRITAEIARELYEVDEVSTALLRAKVDELDKQLAELRAELRGEIGSVAAKIHSVHSTQNEKRAEFERICNRRLKPLEDAHIELFGGQATGGLIGDHSRQLTKLWGRVKDLKTKYWRIVVYLAGAGGGGVAIGKLLL